MSTVIAHLMIWLLGIVALGWLFQVWSRRSDVHPRGLILSGSVLGAFALAVPLLASLSPRPAMFSLRRDVEFWFIWVGFAAFIVFLVWRLNALVANRQRVQRLRQDAWTRGQSDDAEADQELEATRLRLEARLREQSCNPRTILRWSGTQLPFTLGGRAPEVFAPMWAAYEGEGIHMAPLLAHEREHIRLDHTKWSSLIRWCVTVFPPLERLASAIRLGLEVDADRHVVAGDLAKGITPDRYVEALKAVVGPARGSGLEAGLGHDRSNLELRVQQSLTPSRMLWRYPVAGALLLLIQFGCHRLLGGSSMQSLADLATLRLPPNYNLKTSPDGLKLKSLPGLGGDFLDGVRIDARQIYGAKRVEMTLVRSGSGGTKWIGFRGSVDVRVLARPANPTTFPVLMAEALRFGTPNGNVMTHEFVDFHWKQMATSGRYETRVGLNNVAKTRVKADTSETVRWWVQVPVGWELEIRSVRLSPYSETSRPSEEVLTARLAYLNAVLIDEFAAKIPLSWEKNKLYDIAP